MKIESKKVYIVGNREFDTREEATRFAEYGDYSEEIEGYLSAIGLTGNLDRAGLTTGPPIANILVNYLPWRDGRGSGTGAPTARRRRNAGNRQRPGKHDGSTTASPWRGRCS